MSRSLHTQKLEIRAARRMARPRDTRAAEGKRMCGRAAHACPEPVHAAHLLPIQVQRPVPDCLHPLLPGDIRELMDAIGSAAFYGLRTIRLRSTCALSRTGLVFAEYVAPGEIHLYPVPTPPWRLSFVPCAADLAAFTRYGAHCAVDVRRRTTIEWTADALRNFYRTEVLAHELGHHLLQHNRGKRTAQIRRRGDHEAFAELYSTRICTNLAQSRRSE